jgi:hypothetical protein
MAVTTVHGGINISFTSEAQLKSAMSSYALTNHSHTQYLTTAALSNHSHTNYINISASGDVYFVNSNGISFGSIVSGASTTITASIMIAGGNVGNNYFINSNGHSFGSSVSGNSTFNWIII